jgi:hypothetical protein
MVQLDERRTTKDERRKANRARPSSFDLRLGLAFAVVILLAGACGGNIDNSMGAPPVLVTNAATRGA